MTMKMDPRYYMPINEQLGLFGGASVLTDPPAGYGHGREEESRRDAKGRLKGSRQRSAVSDQPTTTTRAEGGGLKAEGSTRWPGLRHRNSMEAWEEVKRGRGPRELAVIEVYERAGRPLTDREVLRGLGHDPASGDPNKARPRINDLIREGVLVEVDKVQCRWTGMGVRRCWFK